MLCTVVLGHSYYHIEEFHMNYNTPYLVVLDAYIVLYYSYLEPGTLTCADVIARTQGECDNICTLTGAGIHTEGHGHAHNYFALKLQQLGVAWTSDNHRHWPA